MIMVLVPAGIAAAFTLRFQQIDHPFWVLGLVAFFAAGFFLRRDAIAHHLERAPGGGGATLALIVLAAFVLRVIWIEAGETEPRSDFQSYLDLARTLVVDGTYGLGGHPSNRRPPGFPFILAGLIRLGLEPVRSGQLFNATVSALTAVPIYLWARDWAGQASGLAAATIFAVMPSRIFESSILGTEPLFTFLVAWASYLFVRMLAAPARRWLLFAFLAGLAAGLATYVRSQGVVVPVAIGFIACVRGPDREQRALRAFAAVAIVIACLIPWAVRNQRAFGRPSLLTAGGGVSAYIGNNARADGRHLNEAEWPERIDRYDEQSQDRIGYDRAFTWIAAHPGRFLALVPKKWAHLFKSEHDAVSWSHTSARAEHFASISHALTQGAYVLLLMLAVAAVWMIRGARLPLFADPAIALLAAWYVQHAFYHAQPRYHAGLVPSFVVLAGLACRARTHPGTNR